MKQLEVQIMGQSYLLGCPENGEQRLREAVSKVDAAMCRIRDAGKIKARDRIAVLAALNLAFEVSENSAAVAAIAAAAAEPAAPAQAAAPSVTAGSDAALNHPQLTALLQRLDAALGVDGQLL